MEKIFNKKNIIIGLAVLFGLQIAVFFLLSVFSSRNIKERISNKPLLKGFKKEDVLSIEIKDYQSSFSIEVKNDNYLVKIGENVIPGDPEKIKYYLELLKNLNQGIKRDKGIDPNNDLFYGLDRERSQDVIVKMKNNKLYTIHLGKQGSKLGTSYLRYDKEKIVREVDSEISLETSNSPSLWAERKILSSINFDDVDSCEIDSKMDWFKGKYTVKYKEHDNKDKDSKKSDNFIIDPPLTGKIKDYALSNVIVGFIQLMIDDYKLSGGITKDNEEKAKVVITLKNGKNFKLTFYKASQTDNSDYIIAVDFNQYLYLIKEEQVKMLIRSTNDFVEKEESKK
jgi:hypothetical protein